MAIVKNLPREVSDHNPLVILTNMSPPSKLLQFKFELSWLKNADFFAQVERIWSKPCRNTSALDKIQQKLKFLKQYIKGWGFNLQGALRKKRKELQDELIQLEDMEEETKLSHAQWQRKSDLLSENM